MNLIDDQVSIYDTVIGNNNWIRVGTILSHSFVTDGIYIGCSCRILNTDIAKNVQIASKVKIGDLNKKTIIEKNVWIGANAEIRQGVLVGEGSVIGANSIIDQDIEPYTIVYGRDNLIRKKRIFSYYGEPSFYDFLHIHVEKMRKGDYLKKDNKDNFISASLIPNGSYHLGKNNFLNGKVEQGGGIFIGKDVEIGDYNILEGAGSIEIGDFTKIGNHVHILSSSHDYRKSSFPMILQPVKIGSNVLIGDNSVVLGGISISDNTKIPANSFILKDC